MLLFVSTTTAEIQSCNAICLSSLSCFDFVGEKIGFKRLFGPAGPDIEQETEISQVVVA
mgnify:CR=1 FL=1